MPLPLQCGDYGMDCHTHPLNTTHPPTKPPKNKYLVDLEIANTDQHFEIDISSTHKKSSVSGVAPVSRRTKAD